LGHIRRLRSKGVDSSMSVNLIVSDYSDNSPKMLLNRFQTGITSSAQISLHDYIRFEGVGEIASIVEITHKWEHAESGIAPVSTVRAVFNGKLVSEEWDTLRSLGFKELIAA
jgi:hypothetical protein